MSADATPNLGLPYIAAAQAQKHVTHNEALHVLDSIVQLAVLDQNLTAPPGSPTEGDRYIVAASATGAWAGHDGEIAAYVDGAWSFHAPGAGWIAFVVDEATLYFWNGTAWASMQGVITALQNLTLLGIGTTADATNPFAAKLNKALWTAKYAAEGGDGDLRYTMNKETTADTVSLLFQKGYSGRAEFGLIGDDNLSFKVSPDGSAWTVAVVIDKTTGAVSLASPLALAQGGTGATTAAGARTALGLGTAATVNTGTSGATVPLLNASNDFSAAAQKFATFGTQTTSNPIVDGVTGYIFLSGGRLTTQGTAHSAEFSRRDSDGDVVKFYRGTTTAVGSISATTTTTSYNTTSDHRLKTDIVDLDDAGAAIDALRPRLFTYISTGERTRGFVAHELARVCPAAVTGEKDAVEPIGAAKDDAGRTIEAIPESDCPEGWTWSRTGERPVYQSVDLTKEITALCVAEIKSLRRRVAALEG